MENETVKTPEEMSLEELKAAALAEEAKEEAKLAPKESTADIEVPAEEIEKEETPEQFVYKKEIDLGDGSGVQVFTGKGATQLEALEELTEKLADAQRHATKKIHELNGRVKADDTRAAQQTFVDSHPDYVKDADNGRRITAEVQRLGYSEFSETSLEKAYQSLKASGLLKLKAEEAGGTTEEETKEPQRIVEPKVEATQPRSSKKASTVSTRGTGAPVVKTGPSEDELYAMPMEKLKQLSNEQLARAGQE